MKIIELRAENVKRLKVVDITPDGTLQIVGGRNAQGKSSVLDAIWLALGGAKAGKDTARPIRDGEDKASVTLNLGELIVTRTWTTAGSKLQVQSADGATHKSPQGMLDALVGQLSFDPLAFTRLSARAQRDALLDLVDLDVNLDELDTERQRLYDQRTDVGRQGKSIGDVTVDDSLPDEQTSATAVLAKIRKAQDHNRECEDARVALTDSQHEVAARQSEVQSLEEQLQEARGKLCAAQEGQRIAENRAAELLPFRSTEALEGELATIEETNAAIQANQQAKERQSQKDQMRQQYEELTNRIDALDKQKAAALAGAEFPIEGLAFDEQGVTYRGVPFSQASSAEQIRVSLAMAMALNPKLRVLRIMDGSLLDEDAMTAIREVVAEHDFQLWIERVGNSDQGAVVLEDGEVAA